MTNIAASCGEHLGRTLSKEAHLLTMASVNISEELSVELKSENLYGTKVIDFSIIKNKLENTRIKNLQSIYTEAPMVKESKELYQNFVIAILDLARKEKTIERLAKEIKKTRTRFNALDLVLIPELKKEIRVIDKTLASKEREEQYKTQLFLEEDYI